MDRIKECLRVKINVGNDTQNAKKYVHCELDIDSDMQNGKEHMCNEDMESGSYNSLREEFNKSKEYLVPDYVNTWKERPLTPNEEESSNTREPYYDKRLIKPAQSKGSYVHSKHITNRANNFLTKSSPDDIYNESMIDFGNAINKKRKAAGEKKCEDLDVDGDDDVPDEGVFINGKKVDLNRAVLYNDRIRQERKGRAEYQKAILQLGASNKHGGKRKASPPPSTRPPSEMVPRQLHNNVDLKKQTSPPPSQPQTSPPRYPWCSSPPTKPCSPPLERPPSPGEKIGRGMQRSFKPNEIFRAWRDEALHAEDERQQHVQQVKACLKRSYDQFNGNEWSRSYGKIYDRHNMNSGDYSTGCGNNCP